MDQKQRTLLLELVGSVINTKYGYGSILGVDDDGIIQMKMAKDKPMFLDLDDLLLSGEDYKKGSMLRKLKQHQAFQKEQQQELKALVEERLVLEAKERVLRSQIENAAKQAVRLKETLHGVKTIGKCFKSRSSKTYIKIASKDMHVIMVDVSSDKRPVVKRTKIEVMQLDQYTEINPETFDQVRDEALKELQ